MGTSQNCCCQCPCPCSEPQPHPTSAGDPLHQQVGLVQSSMRSLLLSLGPGADKTLCVPSKNGISVSPSPVEVLQSNPTGLQIQIPLGFLVPLPDPQAGKPDVGLRTFTTVRELLWYNCSPVCGSPTRWVWDLILL